MIATASEVDSLALLKSTQQILRQTQEQRNEYYKLYSDLQDAVRSFFEYHWDDDGIELSIEDINAFFTKNNIPLGEVANG